MQISVAASLTRWPEPTESVWNMLDACGPCVPGSRLSHLTVAGQLFIAAVANILRPERPWGAITWLAETFNISRPTVYALGERARQGLLPDPGGRPATMPLLDAGEETAHAGDTVVVTGNRIDRTALSMAFPGKVALRPMQVVLAEAFDQHPAVGTLSQLLTHSGVQAGETLAGLDYSPLGSIIAVRDETFFQDWPILIVIEPVSTTILLGVVSTDRQAETWGAALLMAQDQGVDLQGLVEDMARPYPKSQKEIEMDVAVQKDTWHVTNEGGKVRRTLERQALAALRKTYELEEDLLEQWDAALFQEKYIPLVAKAEQLIAEHDAFERWLNHLHDAFELVDLRNGDIRDPATATWLLEEVIQGMGQNTHKKVQKFTRTLRRHQPHLLTFLDWAAQMLVSYRQMLSVHIPDPNERAAFIRIAAHTWRLRQALINGQSAWKTRTQEMETHLAQFIAEDETRRHLADYLMHVLDASGHTSSLIESINGLLKAFLNNRRSFRSQLTLQAYLNLFILWHNMRVYERGKRAGQSPFQWAGIDPGTDDWLELLGFPADA